MPNFSQTSKPRDFTDLIPKGAVAPMVARVKRGGHGDGGWLTLAETDLGQSAYLHLEITLTAGAHKPGKLWLRSTVEGDNHATAIAISFDLLGSVLRSAFNLSSSDQGAEAMAKLNVGYGTFDGLRFIGKVGIERGKLKSDGAPGERWPDKNTLVCGVTRDQAEWKPWGPVEQSTLPDNSPTSSASASSAPSTPMARPGWAQ
jgi:hypothetical protein